MAAPCVDPHLRAHEHWCFLQRDAEVGATTPAGSTARRDSGGAAKTPWRTPPPVFAEAATPNTAIAASGWQELCGAADQGALSRDPALRSGKAQSMCLPDHLHPGCCRWLCLHFAYARPMLVWLNADAQVEPAAASSEWVDDGSLPVDGEGTLPFYMLDAHEEYGAPGTVYLFGKVRRESKQWHLRREWPLRLKLCGTHRVNALLHQPLSMRSTARHALQRCWSCKLKTDVYVAISCIADCRYRTRGSSCRAAPW